MTTQLCPSEGTPKRVPPVTHGWNVRLVGPMRLAFASTLFSARSSQESLLEPAQCNARSVAIECDQQLLSCDEQCIRAAVPYSRVVALTRASREADPHDCEGDA